MTSSADPFLPIQGRDAVRPDHRPVQRADFALEDESEPDVVLGEKADGEGGADEPPVHETPFRRPTGQRVDPADDV
jgi:hypothetical protein